MMMAIDRVAFTIFGKDIYWYSLILVAAVLTVFFLCCVRGKKNGYKDDIFIDLCFIILIAGVIGARALYVIVNWSHYEGDFVSVFKIWEGGLAILGGFVTALPCFVYYCVKKKINFWALLDLIVPCFALAQCIGRWGNFVNQELYGPVVEIEWLQFFPFAVYIDITGEWHMATFFYESVWSLATFIFLSVLYSKKKHDNGDIFFLYIVLYSIIRIILDGIKLDGTLTNQLICVGMIAIVAVLYFVKRKIHHNEAFSQKVHAKIPAYLLSDYVPEVKTAEAEEQSESELEAEGDNKQE